jgi:subtilisin family serine protease
MKKTVIVNLKEGVLPSSILPHTILSNEGDSFEIKPLYKVSNHPLFNETVPDISFLSMEETSAVQNKFCNELNEKEKSLYRTFEIEVPETVNVHEFVKELYNKPEVNFVQQDQMNDLHYIPGDPLYVELYGLKKMDCEKAWDYSSGKEVIVAVVDTGVDYNHPDLKDNMWTDADGNHGYNFSEDNNNPMDYHSHGTHVSGTIASTGNNAIGIIGVAFNAKIMALKIFPNALDSICSKAIVYAVDNGAKVINNSWGPTAVRPSNPLVEQAIDYAVSKGVTVVFAAGNNADDVINYSPANYKSVFCVAATDKNDVVAGFSNYGENVLAAAPGKDIVSLKFNSPQYTIMSGTSMAAPHVSGLAALIVSRYPGLSLEEIKEKIRINVDIINSVRPVGAGRINAFKAVR